MLSFFCASRRRHTRLQGDWSSDVCSSDLAVVESVKAASDVYAPLAGEVTAGNPKLKEKPETLNTDPYGEGWLMRLKPAPGALTGAALLSAADYQKVLEAEGG